MHSSATSSPPPPLPPAARRPPPPRRRAAAGPPPPRARVAPQLIAVAFLVDERFAGTAEPRLFDQARRPPKMVGALVHAYHRLPSPSLPTVAQLTRHDRVMT